MLGFQLKKYKRWVGDFVFHTYTHDIHLLYKLRMLRVCCTYVSV
jgi:hypothetical protein